MGFPESIAALAESLGVPIDRITDHLVPTLATRPLQLRHRLVSPGEVVGITQTAAGYIGDDAVINMKLEMFLDPTPSPYPRRSCLQECFLRNWRSLVDDPRCERPVSCH